jgi:hypothetical protein
MPVIPPAVRDPRNHRPLLRGDHLTQLRDCLFAFVLQIVVKEIGDFSANMLSA